MATKKIQMIPPGYTDVVHPETAADNIVETDNKKVMTGDERTKLGNIPSDAVFTDTVYSHPTTAGNKHIPTGGTVGQILKNTASGTATWQADSDTVTSINGKTGVIAKADITALGIPAQDTVYTHPASHPASMITGLPTSLPADGGDADTVSGFTVGVNVPAGAKFTDTVYTHPTTAGNKHIPTGGASGQVLKYSANGTAVWDDAPAGGGKKVTRFVVGTSTAGWTSADCDYLCDGTSDEVEIIAAIGALPETGGEILILSGVYNIADAITLWRNYVTISGSGKSTILKRMFNNSTNGGLINAVSSYPNCTIRNLQIDGNKAVYTSNKNYGVYAKSTQYCTIKDVVFNNCSKDGVYLYLCSYSTVNGCSFISNAGAALRLSGGDGTVSDNLCSLCGSGIIIDSCSYVVTGNICRNSTTYSIFLVDATKNIISNNFIICGTGLATDYTESQHTIRLSGTGNSYNLISNNNCMGKAVTNEGGTGNTLVNNKFDAT